MIDNMQIIAIVESDDCGPAVICDPEAITVFHFDDFYLAASRCQYSNRPVTCEISSKVAEALLKKGVKCIEALINDKF